MSTKQVQLRRGSKTEHDSFTGAVGELTYVTDNKELRIHDGSTPGGLRVSTDEVVNVKSFGAKGDGVTDDSAAINAAIAHAKTFWEDREFDYETSTPCVLYFPPGIYWCNNTQFDLKLVLETDLPEGADGYEFPERHSSSNKDSTHVTVMGASHQASVLLGGGLTFNSARIDVRNLGFWGRDYVSGNGAIEGGLTAIEYRGGRYDFYNAEYFDGVVGGSGGSGNIENINIYDYDKGIWLRNLVNRTRVSRVNIQGGNIGYFIDCCVGPTLSECDTNQAQQVGFRLYGKLGEVRMSQCRSNGGFRNMEILPVRFSSDNSASPDFVAPILESYFENVSLSGAGGWQSYKNSDQGLHYHYAEDTSKYTYDSATGRTELLVPISSIAEVDSGAKMRITFAEPHRLRSDLDSILLALGSDINSSHGGFEVAGNCVVENSTTILVTLGDYNTTENWTTWDSVIAAGGSAYDPDNSRYYYLLRWGYDLYIDGHLEKVDGEDNDPERTVYDLWFTQCNINHSYIRSAEHLRFNHARLKQSFYIHDNSHNMISFFGNRRGRASGGEDPDILPHGPGAKDGWCSFEVGRSDNDANTTGGGLDEQPVLKMEVPYRASDGVYGTTQADGVPTEFSAVHVHRNKISMHGLPSGSSIPDGLSAGDLWIDTGDNTVKIKT